MIFFSRRGMKIPISLCFKLVANKSIVTVKLSPQHVPKRVFFSGPAVTLLKVDRGIQRAILSNNKSEYSSTLK